MRLLRTLPAHHLHDPEAHPMPILLLLAQTTGATIPGLSDINSVWPMGACLLILLVIGIVFFQKIYVPIMDRRTEERKVDRELREAEMKSREVVVVAHRDVATALASATDNLRETSRVQEIHLDYLRDQVVKERKKAGEG